MISQNHSSLDGIENKKPLNDGTLDKDNQLKSYNIRTSDLAGHMEL